MDRVQAAIEESDGELRPLLQRLDALEKERVSVSAERLRLSTELQADQQEKPNVEAIRQVWSQFVELWDTLTDEEREEAMQILIERVHIHSQTKGTCRIRISAQAPGSHVEHSNGNTPLAIVGATNPSVLEVPLSFPRQKRYA